ncbi:Clp protease N-terminal domain-containing protein [Streptomyces sp. NPDC002690]
MTPLNISLADLIARLDEERPDAGVLARISEAHLRAQTLSDLGDQLIDHYVGEAKRSGASWTEIGEAIGVTKQAAQQRHTPNPFERFTKLNRHSIVLAQEAARTRRHEFIGTEHLLLGLVGEPQGLAHGILIAKAGSEQRVREAIDAVIEPDGRKTQRGHIPFRPEGKEVIEQASRVSADLGHDWVGTEHVLLGLIRVEGHPAAQVLQDLGFTSDELLGAVEAAIAGRSAGRDA